MSDRQSARSPWWVTIVAGMASFLDAAAIVATGTVLVLYRDEFDLTADSIGQFSALLTAMIAVGAIVGGRLGDRYGRRRVFTVTIIMYVLGAILLAAATTPVMIAIGLVLLGFAAGADLPVSIAMISESAPADRRGKLVSFTHVLWVGGILAVNAMGAIVGGMGATGGRIIYAVLAAIAIIVILLRTTLPESETWAAAQQTRTESIATARASGSAFRDAGALSSLLRSRYIVPLVAVGLFYAISNLAANTNGQFSQYLYVEVAGSTVQTASLINIAQAIIGIGALYITMRLVDTRYRMLGFSIGAALTLLAYGIPAIVGVNLPSLMLTALLFAFGGNLAGEPIFKVWSQELFPTLHRASAQGIMIAFTRIVAAAVALVTPALASAGPQALFAAITAASAVAMAIGLFWIPRIAKSDDFDPAAAADKIKKETIV
ncbi:MFS transporter [Pseudoclavibacter terrae]|uniref:MFS transporter n=1 Tax=Pseudoclavibacter terrae TaxID=1530195 RepID=A0A7J5B3Q1_9MICO|nr:MFS transporter [Pseudoclavibacter terrae]KAB1638803.1 MFS transporter [Pseudoclavibacter terrae]